MRRQSKEVLSCHTDRFLTMIVTLFAYLGFLSVVLVRLGTALRGGVYRNEVLIFSRWCGGISVGRVLFPLVLEIMLSGPRLLLSALALGMCVGPCCGSAGPVFPLFIFVFAL